MRPVTFHRVFVVIILLGRKIKQLSFRITGCFTNLVGGLAIKCAVAQRFLNSWHKIGLQDDLWFFLPREIGQLLKLILIPRRHFPVGRSFFLSFAFDCGGNFRVVYYRGPLLRLQQTCRLFFNLSHIKARKLLILACLLGNSLP